MKSNLAAVLNMLIRVQRFLDQNGDSLGTINQSGYRAVLDEAVKELSANDVNQSGSKRAVTAQVTKERVLRNALRINNMRPIATVAAAQLRQVPEFAELKMPAAQTNSRGLIAAAGAMGAAASIYTKTFVDAGLPADFLFALASASDALGTAINSRSTSRSTLRGATAGITAEATRGRQAVNVLDSLVEPLLAGNVVLLSQWQSVKRIGGKTPIVSNVSIDAAAKGATPSANQSAATQSPSVQPAADQPTTPPPTVAQPIAQPTPTQPATQPATQPTTPPATA